MENKLLIRDSTGGIGTVGERKDREFTAKFIKNLDIFNPDYITLSKAPTKVSGSTVTNLVFWAVDGSPYDTNKYFYDLGGKIYRETSGGTWSVLRTVSGATGEGLAIFDDYLYYMLPTEIGRYGRLTGTPAFDDTLTNWWFNALSDIQTTGGGTGQTYSTTTSINEGATHLQTFTAEHDPLKEITIDINDTGDDPDWTVTVHDYEDNEIGSATLAFASVATGDNIFTFATPLRLLIGNEYHFHVTTSTTTGAPKVTTSVASDLEGAEFVVEYGVLINSEFHPAVVVEDKLIIGNESYLAVFDGATYDPNKVLLERGFEIRTITKVDEYIAVGCYKGATVDAAEESRVFLWDTIAASFNIPYDITSLGAPNALTNTGNAIRGIYGNQGGLYEGLDPISKIHEKIPKLARGKTLNVYPGAIADIDGITLLGISGVTDDATGLEQGIYAYGSESALIGAGLSLSYLVSTGTTQGTTLKIGMIRVFGDDIYYSWRDGSSYGVDKILPTASAATSGVYESLIFDNGDADKSKLVIHQVTSFEALESGEAVTNKIKYERGSYTAGTTFSTVGDTRAKDLFNKRFKELEAGFTITSSGGTFPKITQHEILFNDLKEEGNNE